MALYDISKEDLVFDPSCLGDNTEDDCKWFVYTNLVCTYSWIFIKFICQTVYYVYYSVWNVC